MFERNIDSEQVYNCIKSGTIIEEYPDNFPCPSLLSMCKEAHCDLHIVYAICPHYLVVVTAYYSDESLDKKEAWRRI